MQPKRVAYWITTVIIAFIVFFGGAAQLAHQKATVQSIENLGYPAYFVTLLGFWKVLGAAAILVPGLPRFKEWAYAGIFFDLTGADVSLAASHDPAWQVIVILGFAMLTVASWALRPESRRLGLPVARHAPIVTFAQRHSS